MYGFNESIKLVISDGEVLVTTLVAADGFSAARSEIRTEIGSYNGSVECNCYENFRGASHGESM